MAPLGASEPAETLGPDEASRLREEHDRLARAVATRSSIDEVRRGAYASFAAFVSTGLAAKFAWDRWGWGPHRAPIRSRFPLLFLAGLLLALLFVAVASLAFTRARRLMRDEDRDFARLQEIRERLGIEP